MAIIAEVLALVDATVANVAAGTYGDTVAAVRPVVQAASVLVVVLVGANMALQAVPLSVSTIVSVGLRIVLVNVFLIYANLSVPYEALTNAPAELGAGILNSLSGGDVTNLYDGIDDLYSQALNVGQAISQNGGWLAGAMTSVVMFLVAAAMATITIIVLSAAKIMLAVLIAIAPVAVACTLFKQSAPLFEAWVKLAIGFSFVPLFVAAMAGFTIATGEAVAPDSLDGVETLGDAISFIVVMMIGAGLMLLVPTFAQGLAATNIGLASIGANAARMPGNAWRNTGAAIRGGDDMRRGFNAGLQGQGVSDRSSSAARAGSYAGGAVKLAGKMKKG
jgi:type IV secretion system protein VirB6